MESKLNVVIKEPGKEPFIKEIEDDLTTYQEILGGMMEMVPFEKGQVLLCNEEGKLKGLEPNLILPSGEIIVGTAIIVGTDEEEFRSLTDEEAKEAILWLPIMGIRQTTIDDFIKEEAAHE